MPKTILTLNWCESMTTAITNWLVGLGDFIIDLLVDNFAGIGTVVLAFILSKLFVHLIFKYMTPKKY